MQNNQNGPRRYLRIWHIVGCKKRGIAPIIPVSRSSWLAGVKSGRYPSPKKIAPRTLVWLEEDILALLDSLNETA